MSQTHMLRTFGLPVLLLCLAWFSAASLGQAESEPNRRESDGAEEPVPGAEEPTTDAEAVDGPVIPIALRIRVDSPIHPVAAQYIQDSLAEAESREAEVLVVQLDTPGGLLTSTRDITQAFLSSPVPVAVFVSPGGAQAASAGFFLLMAADFAAMAPGTNTGAAHPVSSGGEDIEGDMGKKVEEDTAATIRSLAEHRGRDVELAESAVLESRSFSAEEALEKGLIDAVVPSVPGLLAAMDGLELRKDGADPRTLQTATAELVDRPMPAAQSFLAVVSRPEIAAVLMFLGMLGLYVELNHPGAIFPGVIGAISLILGFYALSILPINYAGFALLLLGVGLFVAETQVPSFGLLSIGGAVSLVLGAIMLFDEFALEETSFDLTGVKIAAGITAAAMSLLSFQSLRVRRLRVTTGEEGLLGEVGTARSDLSPEGRVFVHGELWNAVSEQPVTAAASVRVVGLRGLTLEVEPVEDSRPESRTSDSEPSQPSQQE